MYIMYMHQSCCYVHNVHVWLWYSSALSVLWHFRKIAIIRFSFTVEESSAAYCSRYAVVATILRVTRLSPQKPPTSVTSIYEY